MKNKCDRCGIESELERIWIIGRSFDYCCDKCADADRKRKQEISESKLNHKKLMKEQNLPDDYVRQRLFRKYYRLGFKTADITQQMVEVERNKILLTRQLIEQHKCLPCFVELT